MNSVENEIKDHLLDSLKEKLIGLGIGIEDIDEEFGLIDSGLLDSMGFLDLIASVEDRFVAEIDFEEYDPSEFTTFYGFIRCAAKGIGDGHGKN